MPVANNNVNTVHNHDVAFIADNITRFVVEAHKSSSSGLSGMNNFDQARLLTYLDAIDAAHDWSLANPLLDLPETHPHDWPIEPFPLDLANTDVESEVVNQVIRLFAVCWDELVNSASARQGSTITNHDSVRLRSYVEKVRNFLSDYVTTATPLDLPESSPKETGSGAGLRGVNPSGGR